MTPQSVFMVHARIVPAERAKLVALLETMNQADVPGSAEPMNALVPFGEFGTLHFARFVIMEDQTLEDFKFWNLPPPVFAVSLVFIGDCDGPADALLAAFAEHDAAAAGLRRIFGHCEGFDSSTDLLAWMRQHSVRASTNYVNWIGRTVPQIRREAALRAKLQGELATYVAAHPNAGEDVRHLRDHLRGVAQQHPELMPAKTRTPIGWWIGNALHWAILPVLLILSWAFAIPAFVCYPVLAFWVVLPFVVLAALAFLYLIWVAPFTFALLVALGLMSVPVIYPLSAAARPRRHLPHRAALLREKRAERHSGADHRTRPRARQARGSRHYQSVFDREPASSRARSAARCSRSFSG